MLIGMISACEGGTEEQNTRTETVDQDMNITDLAIAEEENITENIFDEDENITAIIVEAERNTTKDTASKTQPEVIIPLNQPLPVDANDTKEEVVNTPTVPSGNVTTPVNNPNTNDKNSPLIINGYTLPPEPGSVVNNATLLGIDSNNNGVRDDVERYIILRFAKEKYPKTRTALGMQYAWAMQKVIENPVQESAKYIDDALYCEHYWYSKQNEATNQRISELVKSDLDAAMSLRENIMKWEAEFEVFDDKDINAVLLNTRERMKQEFAFNGAMSGGAYPVRRESLENCQVNIDLFGE